MQRYYGRKRNTGRPSALTTREKRGILRAVSRIPPQTAKQIAREAGVETNV